MQKLRCAGLRILLLVNPYLKVQITQLINRKEKFCNNQNAHKYSRSLEQKDQKASDAFDSNMYANSY